MRLYTHKQTNMNIIKATFVSIWDGDRIETNCDFNPETKEVTNIQTVVIGNNYNTCEREFVELPDGTELDIEDLNIEK
jgi:hypothetical protein